MIAVLTRALELKNDPVPVSILLVEANTAADAMLVAVDNVGIAIAKPGDEATPSCYPWQSIKVISLK